MKRTNKNNIVAGFSLAVLMTVLPLQAGNYYMTLPGSGSFSGTNFANALPITQLNATLNTRMVAGDTLYLASGTYVLTGASAISITTSGAPGSPKRLVGVKSGTNQPVLVGAGETTGWGIKLTGASATSGVSHWVFENLNITNVAYGVFSTTTTSPNHNNLVFRNLHISNMRWGMLFRYCDDLRIENSTAIRYLKNGFCIDYGCDRVNVIGCVANLTGNDNDDHFDSQYAKAESVPYGFVSAASGTVPNTALTFTNCVAKNNRCYNPGNPVYFNGDGFDTEIATRGVVFTNCVSINNDDAGFDCKQAPGSTIQYRNCKAIANSNNFKAWSSTHTYNNCVAVYARRRETGTASGSYAPVNISNDVAGFSGDAATLNINYCTALANGLDSTKPGDVEPGNGVRLTTSGTARVVNSIIAFENSAGQFSGTSGIAVVTFVNSATCRPFPLLPGWPNFGDVPAVLRTWNGIGTGMDSFTYGLTKGYHSTRP